MATHDLPVLTGGKIDGGVVDLDTVSDGTSKKLLTSAERIKLGNVATGATANANDAQLRDRSSHTGTQTADTVVDGATNKAFTATERSKLAGIATGATANSSDAQLRDRTGHTGTQLAATISDLGGAATKNVGTSSTTVAAGDAPAAAQAAAIADAATKYARGEVGLANTPAAGVASALFRNQSAVMHLISDSTGDTQSEWFGLLGGLIADKYTGHNVVWRPWNAGTVVYDPPFYMRTGASGIRYTTFASGGLVYDAPSVIGDLEIVVQARMANWGVTGTTQTLVAKHVASGTDRGFRFEITTTGRLSLTWSTNGTTTLTATATAATPLTNGQFGWVRVQLDVDNGASGNTVTFYTSPDGLTWNALGSPVVTASTTSIWDNSTVPYSVGSYSNAVAVAPFAGDIAWVEVRNGIAGPSVVPPLLESWEQVTASGTDTVLHGGSPTILLVAGAAAGQNIAYFTTNKVKMLAPHGAHMVFLSTGHNESQFTNTRWISTYSAWVADVKTMLPNVPIVAVGQNPAKSPITANNVAIRSRRMVATATWVRAQQGMSFVDTYRAFTDLPTQVNADGIHPTVPVGTAAWAAFVYASIFPVGF